MAQICTGGGGWTRVPFGLVKHRTAHVALSLWGGEEDRIRGDDELPLRAGEVGGRGRVVPLPPQPPGEGLYTRRIGTVAEAQLGQQERYLGVR